MSFNFIKIFILILVIMSCTNGKTIEKNIGKQIEINELIEHEPRIQSFLKPYKKLVQDSLSQVLCYSLKSHSKSEGKLNSAIGNMMADAIFEIASPIYKKTHNIDIDIVLLNYGGIRASLPKGNIKMENAYEIMPFENKVVVAKMKFEVVQKMIKYLISEQKAHPISGMEIGISKNGDLEKFKIQDQTPNPNRSYFIATSDYLFNGGDKMIFFKNSDSIYEVNYKVRDMLIDYFENIDSLKIKSDNRFIYYN